MLENIEDKRKKGQQRMRWLGSIIDSMDMSKLQEIVEHKGVWRAAVHRVTKIRTQLGDFTTVKDVSYMLTQFSSVTQW